MNTAGIVVVSLFLGALFIVILLALATLIYLHLQLKKAVADVSVKFAATAKEINDSITGARTSFTGIRQDVKTALDNHGNQVADVLAKHQKAFEETVGKVNGAALEAACVRIIKATGQISGVAKTLQAMLYAADGGLEPPAPSATPLAPEEYAPEDTIYSAQSPAAKMDSLAEALDAIEFQSDKVLV
jgi:hypothetical protein